MQGAQVKNHWYHQSVKQFGSRSGPTFCRAYSGSKLFAKIISRHTIMQRVIALILLLLYQKFWHWLFYNFTFEISCFLLEICGPRHTRRTAQLYFWLTSHLNYFLASCNICRLLITLCKQFGPRSGPTFWSWSGSKLFVSLIVFLKEFLNLKS